MRFAVADTFARASTLVYAHLGGFESTQIFGSGIDILGTTKHVELWREDLNRLLCAGIKTIRYSIPWHRIERKQGQFDWTWVDGPVHFMQANGINPILDPLHHTSFPDWLTNGFLHPDFPSLYCRFLDKLSRRYPFVRDYTVFNEPLATTLFCSYTGMWYPTWRPIEPSFKWFCGSDGPFATAAPYYVQTLHPVLSI